MEEALRDAGDNDTARSRMTNGTGWWSRIFLGDETVVRVRWNEDFDAEAWCSRQKGTETKDYFVGRLWFTGELYLREGHPQRS